jgi:hypothetical protein
MMEEHSFRLSSFSQNRPTANPIHTQKSVPHSSAFCAEGWEARMHAEPQRDWKNVNQFRWADRKGLNRHLHCRNSTGWQERSILRAFFPCLESVRLIPRSVEDVQNIGSSACCAIVDQIFSRGKALDPCGNVIARFACIGMFAEQPEAVYDTVNQTVRDLYTCALGPIKIDVVEILFRVAGNTVAHRVGSTGVPASP